MYQRSSYSLFSKPSIYFNIIYKKKSLKNSMFNMFIKISVSLYFMILVVKSDKSKKQKWKYKCFFVKKFRFYSKPEIINFLISLLFLKMCWKKLWLFWCSSSNYVCFICETISLRIYLFIILTITLVSVNQKTTNKMVSSSTSVFPHLNYWG